MPKTNLDDSVSLFPFLSILAAVIGILVLMITAVTLGQIGQDAQPDSAETEAAVKAAEAARERALQYKSLRDQLKADLQASRELSARLEQLEGQQYDAKVQANTLAQLRQELAELEAARDAAMKSSQDHTAELEKQTQLAARLRDEIKQLEDRLKPLLEQLEQLRKQLAERKTPPPEAQVQVRPSGSGSQLKPTFVECAAGSIVLHDRPTPLRIPNPQVASHPEFLQLLDRVRDAPRSTVVFLIRPDGVGTYNLARGVARGRSVTNGKLAIGSQGKLDLSLFVTGEGS